MPATRASLEKPVANGIPSRAPAGGLPNDQNNSWQLPTESLEHSRIFIVDDEELNIRVARKYLRSWGYNRVTATAEPLEAVALIRDEQSDLVLLDAMTPGISGLDLLEALRADPLAAYVPVIVLTAHFEDEVRHQALDRGANGVPP